jgi:hypothetical protein
MSTSCEAGKPECITCPERVTATTGVCYVTSVYAWMSLEARLSQPTSL